MLVLQIAILILNLSGLHLVGMGVDYIDHEWRLLRGESGLNLLSRPLGWLPTESWRPIKVLGVVSLAILALNFLRFLLSVGDAILTNYIVQSKLVVDLRAAVYDRMPTPIFFTAWSKTMPNAIWPQLAT